MLSPSLRVHAGWLATLQGTQPDPLNVQVRQAFMSCSALACTCELATHVVDVGHLDPVDAEVSGGGAPLVGLRQLGGVQGACAVQENVSEMGACLRRPLDSRQT